MTPTDLLERQREIEEEGLAKGRAKAAAEQRRKIAEGEAHTLSPVVRAVVAFEDRMREAVVGFFERKRGRGRPPEALKLLEDHDPGLIASEGLRSLFQSCLDGSDVRAAVCKAGEFLEVELWLAQEAGTDAKRVRKALEKATQVDKRVRDASVKMQLGAEVDGEVGPLGWDVVGRARVGEMLLQCAIEIGLFEQPVTLSEENLGTTELPALTLVPAVAEVLGEALDRLAWARASRPVMVVPPRPWDRTLRGPYLSRRLNRHISLVRGRQVAEDRERMREAAEAGELDELFEALNTMGAVPLRIDTEAVDAYEWAFENDLGLKKMPRRQKFHVPELPADIKERPIREQKKLRSRRRKAQQREKGRQTLCVFLQNDIRIARELSQYREVFLPCNIDSRQRVYPIPWFNHHRSDGVRAFWRFAKKEPLGLTGGYMLAVTVATFGGFDKIDKRTLDERFLWTDLNSDVICDIAENWRENLLWTEADKPFQFLSACREWKSYVDSGLSDTFESDLVGSLDGSNSGVQHLSGMSLDRDEAALVNLVPGKEGRDAYQTVASRVYAQVERDAADEEHRFRDLAEIWRERGVQRGDVKRNVMTYVYSSGRWGFRTQLLTDYMDPLEEKVLAGELEAHPFGETAPSAAGYLAGIVYDEVERLLPAASARMRWLQQIAGLLAHEGKPVRWRTPIGTPISHRYTEWQTTRTILFRTAHLPKLEEVDGGEDAAAQLKVTLRSRPLERIDKTKQRNAIAPNFVHSHDSTHLIMVVNRAAREGINHMLLIHDSFGAHLGKLRRLGEIVREEFVRLYTEHDVLDELYRQVWEDLSEAGRRKLQKMEHAGRPPERGSWDVREALQAELAFS